MFKKGKLTHLSSIRRLFLSIVRSTILQAEAIEATGQASLVGIPSPISAYDATVLLCTLPTLSRDGVFPAIRDRTQPTIRHTSHPAARAEAACAAGLLFMCSPFEWDGTVSTEYPPPHHAMLSTWRRPLFLDAPRPRFFWLSNGLAQDVVNIISCTSLH